MKTLHKLCKFIILFGIVPCPNALSLLTTILRATMTNVCYQDPVLDISLTKDLINSNGHKCDLHRAKTEDGYIILLHRIINYNNQYGSPVLIQHGFITASDALVMRGENFSLALQLADAGFDVWLSDQRGNWYSREHHKYKPNDPQFWNFSFHECGYYDLPAIIDKILNITHHRQIFYIGHSMGTTVFLIMSSMRPEYNNKVKTAILLAPLAITPNIRTFSDKQSTLKLIIEKADALYKLFLILGHNEFLPRSSCTIKWIKKMCKPNLLQEYCLDILALATGEHRENIDKIHINDYLSFFPAGSSLRTAHHLTQLFTKGFRRYDYGENGNLITYGNVTPPLYPLQKVTTPVALYWGRNDIYINKKSIADLAKALPNLIKNHQITDPKFNHIDFILGINSAKLVNEDVVLTLKNY